MNTQCPNSRRIYSLIGAMFIALGFAAQGRSDLITVKFAGTVTNVAIRDSFPGVDFPDVGDPFTGFYTFDSTAGDLHTSPNVGYFLTTLTDAAVGVRIGDFQFSGGENGVFALNSNFDGSQRYGVNNAELDSLRLTSHPVLGEVLPLIVFSMGVGGDSLFSDPNILPPPPSLTPATQGSLSLRMNGPGHPSFPFDAVSIFSSLDSLILVPEPASLLLVVLGLAYRRRMLATFATAC